MSRGVVLGIASGRGRSVGTALRESFDVALHHKIIVGYYNGAHIRRLDAGPPEQAGATSPRLENVAALLRNHPLLPSLATFDVKMQTKYQLRWNTLPTNARFGSLPPAIADALSDIMSRGVVLGIASGRGRSVGTALRESFDVALHHKIIVGYYNGAHIRRLDAGPPEQAGATSPRLENVAALLRNHPLLPSLATFDVKMQQLTLMPMADVPLDLVHEIVTEIATAANIPKISVMRSSHSIDVLGSDISKHSVVEACLEVIRRDRPDGHVLRLGDKGNHTGNDFALLSTPHALSVADCPKNTLWAWNLAPPGHLGPHATLDYIEAMRFESGGFHIDTTSLVRETL